MTEKILAYCGILCNECPIYIATQNNDQKAKEELAVQCSNDRCKFEPEDMYCLGCFKVDVQKSKMCSHCEIRACAVQKDIVNCGECDQFPCATVEKLIPADSEGRARLNQIKMSRGSL